MTSENPSSQAAIDSTFADMLREQSGFELSDLDRETSFIELGFDSLFLIQMCMQIHRRFKTKVSFRQLMEETPTIETLLAHLASNSPIAKTEAKGDPVFLGECPPQVMRFIEYSANHATAGEPPEAPSASDTRLSARG